MTAGKTSRADEALLEIARAYISGILDDKLPQDRRPSSRREGPKLSKPISRKRIRSFASAPS